jgi:serine/threonine/tyrosine-interacting protein
MTSPSQQVPGQAFDWRATVPYTDRKPSPPFIPIPVQHIDANAELMTLPSRLDSVDGGFMTEMERAIITQNETIQAYNMSVFWEYKMRHDVQKVAPWLYIGPRTVLKEKRAFLLEQGITKVILVLETLLSRMMETYARDASQALGGIDVTCIIADTSVQLMHQFPDLLASINHHLVKTHQDQVTAGVDGASIKRGKVLVACQTGNDRANVVAAAYLMATYGCEMTEAVQFVGMCRFCCDFNEEAKRALLTFGDLIKARSALRGPSGSLDSSGFTRVRKRNIHETEAEDEAMGGSGSTWQTDLFTRDTMDAGRFSGREAFKPFVEVPQPPKPDNGAGGNV